MMPGLERKLALLTEGKRMSRLSCVYQGDATVHRERSIHAVADLSKAMLGFRYAPRKRVANDARSATAAPAHRVMSTIGEEKYAEF